MIFFRNNIELAQIKKICDKLDKLDKQQNKTKQQKCVQLQRAANFFLFTPCLHMLGN